ncbi:DUF421 domain-containing protein [Lactococcus lactis]|jgi:uncharacterized membrane protein YcaP (DUF421 family)|uniref:DUF421 domain-containing protein n=1 Tax=Lactococcus lactis TaxID=1358 RepID=UPI001455DE1A|nr:DUF421 domain-containing protein [Lactococcus lactis]MCT0437766.1 DUF421 domain-containing protein [Lactococcus lactis subsp. lactis]MCT0449076.1 DUF421 domain-containing protein [Lactococcus lactis subsp. lactis]MCT2921089.1 DUF421 domain-containing protein [Lactococcus lactis]MDG4967513.1 DUF421 domain-containing protein [Lactococcus lactis]MDG4973053.1 DUF421 domain-containing protein [Lactococcus lactis]
MQLYSPIIIKFALGIICLIIQINIMGKGNLAPSSAMDQVQNYVLGGIIGGVIYNDSITVLQFVLVLIIWTLLVLILKFLKEHNRYIKVLVDGKPLTLIQDGQVKVNDCLKNGISANELMFKLRANGIYEIQDVKRAILEQNGQLTIIEFGGENIKYPIIVDGQSNFDVLELINKDESWLEQEIIKQGYDRINDVYLGEYLSGELKLYGYQK